MGSPVFVPSVFRRPPGSSMSLHPSISFSIKLFTPGHNMPHRNKRIGFKICGNFDNARKCGDPVHFIHVSRKTAKKGAHHHPQPPSMDKPSLRIMQRPQPFGCPMSGFNIILQIVPNLSNIPKGVENQREIVLSDLS